MKTMKAVLIAVSLLLFIGQGIVFAGESAGEPGLGEKLVRQLWVDMSSKNIKAIEKYIAPNFQSIHADGARDHMRQIDLIKGLDIKKYTLSNFKATQEGPVVIVTYFVSVEETIDGKRLSAKPAARLSAWLKTDSGWKWIIHANLRPLQ
ncbi:MAG: hypothetical protein A4E64_01090 [Syntrophorhabdus sp. PtaU1.Bin058]|nr:MAG: hypothetical protein A4E64_01090 [Syntrophorhabdus sp. PtaU1.Bin058]